MNFSLRRVWALIVKEFLQMRRDRLTLAMIVGVPLAQLFLFGFAINFNPRDLPTAIAINDPGVIARSIVAALANSSYFKIIEQTNDPAHARELLKEGKVLFVVEIPPNFSRDIVKGQPPDLLIEADATDPAAGSFALAAFNQLGTSALRDDLWRWNPAQSTPSRTRFCDNSAFDARSRSVRARRMASALCR